MSAPSPRTAVRLAAAALVALASAASAQPVPSDSAILAIVKARVDSGRGPGIVVGVLENGRRRYVAYGSAGPGRGRLDEHTLFEIGSISKTFTGLLLADAVGRGEVRLDQPVAELLPAGTAVPSRDGRAITLVGLSTHRSGLPRMPSNFAPADPADPFADYDARRLYAFLASYQLPRAPGDSAEYSNVGVGLLGHALARRAGAATWGALVEHRITGPLGMRESWVDVPAAARARVAAGHDLGMDTVPAWHLDALAGAGALRSTAADMLTYLAAQLDTVRGPLARAVALAQHPHAAMGPNGRIGLGWITRGPAGRPVWWHNGGTAGFRTYAAFDPARRAAVVVLTNSGVGADDIGVHLLDPSSPLRMPPVPPRRAAISLPTAALDRVVGAYQLTPAVVLTVTRQGSQLSVQLTGQERLPIHAAAPDRFFLRVVDAELHFALGPTGPAASVTLVQNGRSQLAPRIHADAGPSRDGGAAADTIRRLDSAWARAYAVHDTALAAALFADDLVATSSGGVVKGKPGEMADVRPQPGLQMAYFRTEQVDVRVHGAAAVATGLAQWSFTSNGQATTLRRRYTSTYVRGGPLGWRMVALHLGPAPGAATSP
jgi:CubicO group peptidase (beta-lactamase class C family)/ketosteroid isomerase-like protein